MNTPAVEPLPGRRPVYAVDDVDAPADARGHAHGICWAAIAAGALGAAALSLILLMLGVGLGLSSVSPWASEGVSAETFGVSTIVWLAFTQLAASGMGGYLAGRLRARWAFAQADEVYFRDTAHGFLAWSLATLVTAGLLSSAVGAIVSGGAKAGAAVAGTAAATVAAAAPAAANAASGAGMGQGYFADALFRRDAPAAAPAASAASASDASATAPGGDRAATDGSAAPAGKALRIFANAASAGALPPDDARYLGQLVAQRTGLTQAEAEKRVTDTFNRMQAKANAAKEEAKAAADKARKASAMASLWMFVSLLIGAFVASFAATLGGRHRDQF